MMVSTTAQEDLENIKASVRVLVPAGEREKEKVVMGKFWDFGPSLMTERAIRALEK